MGRPRRALVSVRVNSAEHFEVRYQEFVGWSVRQWVD